MTLTVNLLNKPWSKVNMPIASPHTTSYLIAIEMFALPVTTSKIFTIKNVHDHELSIASMTKVNISIKSQYLTSYFMAIVMLALFVPVFKIIKFDILK